MGNHVLPTLVRLTGDSESICEASYEPPTGAQPSLNPGVIQAAASGGKRFPFVCISREDNSSCIYSFELLDSKLSAGRH